MGIHSSWNNLVKILSIILTYCHLKILHKNKRGKRDNTVKYTLWLSYILIKFPLDAKL